jgi:hypothetical protein
MVLINLVLSTYHCAISSIHTMIQKHQKPSYLGSQLPENSNLTLTSSSSKQNRFKDLEMYSVGYATCRTNGFSDTRCYQPNYYQSLFRRSYLSKWASNVIMPERKLTKVIPITIIRQCKPFVTQSTFMRFLILTASLLLLAMMLSSSHISISAYPIVMQVDELSERCIRFNIPDGEE